MPYIPKGLVTSGIPNERIAIIGPPGSGKTTSLLTFPDLVVFDLDRKLPTGVANIPAWNPDWADEVIGGKGRRTFNIANIRDASLMWIRDNITKFEPEQTFAIDSWTFLMDFFAIQTYAEDEAAKESNGFFFWGQKLKYATKLMSYLKSAKCRVVVTMHETIDRDEKGNLNGKIRPLMNGGYQDQLLGGFTHVWRMRGNVVPKAANGTVKRKADGTVDKSTLAYFWQVAGDSIVDINNGEVLDRILKNQGIESITITRDNSTGKVTGGYQTIAELYKTISQPVVGNAEADKQTQ
jgi:hypothetical protein